MEAARHHMGRCIAHYQTACAYRGGRQAWTLPLACQQRAMGAFLEGRPFRCQLDRHVRDGERVDIMNPLKWSSRDQVALVLGAVIGIALWLAIGFMYDGIVTALAPGGPNAAFHNKTTGGIMLRLATGSALRWAVFGALVGGGLLYTRQLLHE